MSKYLPMGISFAQAKKEAKRIAKQKDIKLHEAQDIYIKSLISPYMRGREEYPLQKKSPLPRTWNKLSTWVEDQGECLGVLSFATRDGNITRLSVYESKPILFITGSPGSGKAFAIKNLADKWLRGDKKAHYFGFANSDDHFYKAKHPGFKLYNMKGMINEKFPPKDEMLALLTMISETDSSRGDLLVIDEMARFIYSAKKCYPDFIKDLIAIGKEKGLIMCLLTEAYNIFDYGLIEENRAAYLNFWTGWKNRVPLFLLDYLDSKGLTYEAPKQYHHYTMLVDHTAEYFELKVMLDEEERAYLDRGVTVNYVD